MFFDRMVGRRLRWPPGAKAQGLLCKRRRDSGATTAGGERISEVGHQFVSEFISRVLGPSLPGWGRRPH